MHDRSKPLVMLFMGPSGTGKTESAEQIAKVLTGKPLESGLVFHMGQYAQGHEIAKLQGAPPGYTGDKDGQLIQIRRHQQPIILLDEVDKAEPNVLAFFLSVFQKGQYTTGSGKVVDCSSAVFLLTCNFGAKIHHRASHIP